MSSFFGRYLRVEMPEIGLDFISNFDKDQYGKKAPRIKVQANFQRNAFVQGKVSIYGLNDKTRAEMQKKDFTVNIYAGYKNVGNSQIIRAEKKFFEIVRVGADLITNIYFLSFGKKKLTGDSIPVNLLSSVIKTQASKFNYSVNFDDNPLLGVTVDNISLMGTFQDRMDKLASLYNFEYYEQNGQIVISKNNRTSLNVIEIDSSNGILNIPAFSNIGLNVDLKIMFNNDLRIGRVFKVTNKYARINIGDNTKSFAGELVQGSLANVKDIPFRVVDINYNLDTMGDDFYMTIEGLKV